MVFLVSKKLQDSLGFNVVHVVSWNRRVALEIQKGMKTTVVTTCRTMSILLANNVLCILPKEIGISDKIDKNINNSHRHNWELLCLEHCISPERKEHRENSYPGTDGNPSLGRLSPCDQAWRSIDVKWHKQSWLTPCQPRLKAQQNPKGKHIWCSDPTKSQEKRSIPQTPSPSHLHFFLMFYEVQISHLFTFLFPLLSDHSRELFLS